MNEDTPAVTLSSRTTYTGRIFAVAVDRVRTPRGREVDMELVRHPGSVVLIPMQDADRVLLVRQYRYAIDRWIWELPAGSLAPGEDPEAAARRECHEEVGLVPGRLERLGEFYPTPGYCDERMIFFRASDLREPATAAEIDEDEDLEPRLFTLVDVRRMIRSGDIIDLKTALGISLIGRSHP
jgi:ADP-ribose pyrophosphatase